MYKLFIIVRYYIAYHIQGLVDVKYRGGHCYQLLLSLIILLKLNVLHITFVSTQCINFDMYILKLFTF